MGLRRVVFSLFNRLGFNHKLFLSYLIVIIIPVAVLGIYSYNQSREMLKTEAQQSMANQMRTVTNQLNGSMKRYDDMLQSIIYNTTYQKIVNNDYLDLVNLSNDLKYYLEPNFVVIRNLDRSIEKIKFYTDPYVPEYGDIVQLAARVKEEQWYERTVMNQGRQTNWFYEERLFVTALFPYHLSFTKNIVYLQINGPSFFEEINELAQSYGVVVTDKDNRIIIDQQQSFAHDPLTLEQLQHIGEGFVKPHREQVLVMKQAIDSAGWTVYSFTTSEQLLANSPNAIIVATLFVIFICIIVLLVIIAIFSKTMIRGIKKLIFMMKRVEEGELELIVQSRSNDEIGQLTNQFGSMLTRLNEQIEATYQSKIKQQKAELTALQWQMNPHFLYNTLSFINWRVIRSEDKEISMLITSLAQFYRSALNKGNSYITIREELNNIKHYLNIIEITGSYSFDTIYEVEAGLDDYYVINLIFQPLVENAIKHGIHKKTDGRGLLIIKVQSTEGDIILSVTDNGIGMDEAQVKQLLATQFNGYGLKNMNERISLLFGQEYGLHITSQFGSGTSIDVRLPLKHTK